MVGAEGLGAPPAAPAALTPSTRGVGQAPSPDPAGGGTQLPILHRNEAEKIPPGYRTSRRRTLLQSQVMQGMLLPAPSPLALSWRRSEGRRSQPWWEQPAGSLPPPAPAACSPSGRGIPLILQPPVPPKAPHAHGAAPCSSLRYPHANITEPQTSQSRKRGCCGDQERDRDTFQPGPIWEFVIPASPLVLPTPRP